jgi:hypothetical protein
MVRAEAELSAAQLEVKRWEVFLKWIDDQYPAIAAECGYPTNDSVNDVPLESLRDTRGLRPRPLRGKCAQLKSVLSPNSLSRISKPPKGKSNCHHKPRLMSFDISPPTTTQQHPVEEPSPLRQSERLKDSKARKPAQVPEMRIFSPARSSRVTKAKAISHPTNIPGRRTAQNGRSTAKWSGTKLNATSRNSNVRRSQRIMAQMT